MLRDYRQDPYFLLRYYRTCALAYGGVVAFLVLVTPWKFEGSVWLWMALLLPLLANSFLGMIAAAVLTLGALIVSRPHLGIGHAGLVVLGIYFGMVAVQLIHNCAHKSFKPRWLNRILGELLAIHLLSGFPSFAILHLEHHRHADHPELDPHPNEDLTFSQYLFSIKGKLKRHFRRAFFERWGHLPNAEKIWGAQQLLLPLNRVLRAWILLLLFGPVGFVLILIPSFIANHLTFAHINFYTHAKREDGTVEILNLDHNWLYKFLNLVMIGGYFHKNHHLAPSLFNPAHYRPRQ